MIIHKRKMRVFWIKYREYILVGGTIGFVLGLIIGTAYKQYLERPVELISPCPIDGCEVQFVAEPTPTPTPSPTPTPKPTSGKASYYSVAGCLGCSPTLTMANGEKLDDTKLTVAYNHAPLNSYITITHAGQSVKAKVTDRGGFERHGKIIDLSVATKNALRCGDVCAVSLDL